MVISGIYKIVNKINGKFYIGSSTDIKRRYSRHLSDLKKNKHDNQHLQLAWNKYGPEVFLFEIYKVCEPQFLLEEEQKELNIWVGKNECYNMRKDAKCPIAPGSKRPRWIVEKYSNSQRGKSRWSEEQRKQMSIDRLGRKHKPETLLKLKTRPKSCYTGIIKAQQTNNGRIYSENHCKNISVGKLENRKIFTNEELRKIREGVQKAILEGRYRKNKIPKSDYETIKSLYLNKELNQRQLAIKYGVTAPSMAKMLKKLGAK